MEVDITFLDDHGVVDIPTIHHLIHLRLQLIFIHILYIVLLGVIPEPRQLPVAQNRVIHEFGARNEAGVGFGAPEQSLYRQQCAQGVNHEQDVVDVRVALPQINPRFPVVNP